MPSPAATEKRVQAHAASHVLAAIPGVHSIVLFGSVARGDAGPRSDIDLIVLGEDDQLTSSELRRRLIPVLADADISVSYHTPESLNDYLDRWSRFGAHLRVEGQILHDPDGELRRILSTDRPLSTTYEFAAQARHLARYTHVQRFGGRFLFPLAHLYRIGRAATFAVIAEGGQLEFDRDKAFEIAARLHPDLQTTFATISGLAPFYDCVREAGDAIRDLPFDPTGPDAASRFLTARNAVARVVALGDHG